MTLLCALLTLALVVIVFTLGVTWLLVQFCKWVGGQPSEQERAE